MDKLERMLNLVAMLLHTNVPMSWEQIRSELADYYPDNDKTARRTFERDKDTLRSEGIPLITEDIAHTLPVVTGYRINPNDYYLNDPGLEPDELAALHLASLAVQTGGANEALWKLGGVVEGESPISSEQTLASVPLDDSVPVLFQAIGDARQAKFSYSGSERTIDPWNLRFERGRWYVTGYDHSRHAERNFRIDRIEGPVTILESRAKQTVRRSEARNQGPLPAWQMGEEEPVVALLAVDKLHVETVKRQLGQAATIALNDDGSAVFDIPVVNFEAFRTFVLGLLDHAELLSPPHWRAELIAWLQQLSEPASGS